MMMMLHARASSCWTCTSEPSREVCGCVRLCILSSVCAAFVYRLCSCVENAHRDRNRRVADGAQPRRGLARQQLRAPARLAQAAVATRHQHHLLRCGHVQEADAALLHPRRRRRPQWRQRCSLRWKRRRRRRRKWRGRGLHRASAALLASASASVAESAAAAGSLPPAALARCARRRAALVAARLRRRTAAADGAVSSRASADSATAAPAQARSGSGESAASPSAAAAPSAVAALPSPPLRFFLGRLHAAAAQLRRRARRLLLCNERVRHRRGATLCLLACAGGSCC